MRTAKTQDQTGQMPRLIWVFAGSTLTSLVFSCRGSNTGNKNCWKGYKTLFPLPHYEEGEKGGIDYKSKVTDICIMSQSMTKPTKWPVRSAKSRFSPINLCCASDDIWVLTYPYITCTVKTDQTWMLGAQVILFAFSGSGSLHCCFSRQCLAVCTKSIHFLSSVLP